MKAKTTLTWAATVAASMKVIIGLKSHLKRLEA